MGIHQLFLGQAAAAAAGVTMVYDSKVDFAINSTSIRGPTIPNIVDDTYIGVLIEFSASAANIIGPAGWTFIGNIGTSGAVSTAYYKRLSVADRGTSPGATLGGNQRDQLLLFRATSGTISSISASNHTSSSVTGNLTSNAPSPYSSSQSAICVHFYYNSTTGTPTLSSTPTMTILRNSLNAFQGSQYKVYNGGTLSNQTAGGTLAGTIRQHLFWLVVS